MVVGAALSILGGVLAQFLNYRFESRAWKRELMKERLEEVRRVALGQLGLARSTSIMLGREGTSPTTDSGRDLWADSMFRFLERAEVHPGVVAGLATFTDDQELRELLTAMQGPTGRVVEVYEEALRKRVVPEWGAEACEESDAACKKVLTRVDEVLMRV